MMKRWWYPFGLLVCLWGSVAPAQAAFAVAEPPAVASAADPVGPYLRERMPAATVAYLRIPRPWALLDTPTDNAMAPTFFAPAMRATVAALRAGLVTRWQDKTDDRPWLPIVELLLQHTRSPLEWIVTPPPPGIPFPLILASVAVDFPDLAAANAWLTSVSQQLPVQRIRPLTDTAPAELRVMGLPLALHFDPATGRLTFMPAAQAETLSKALAGLKVLAEHPMWAEERAIDDSGQGLFVWVDADKALELAEQLGLMKPAMALRGLGLGEAEAISLGIGTSGGMGRLGLRLAMPMTGLRLLLPAGQNQSPLLASGTPRLVARLSLPSVEEWQRMERLALSLLDEQAKTAYRRAMGAFTATLGASVNDLLAAVGPDLTLLFDEHGEYLALRLREPERFADLLRHLVETRGMTHALHPWQGQTLHALTVPAQPLPAEVAAKLPALAAEFGQLPSHLFWAEEGDYLVFAALPQVLMDRYAAPPAVAIDDWLRHSQGLAAAGNLLLVSTRLRDIPRRLYYAKLGLMQALGDLLAVPVDLFAIPSATALGLPATGGYSLRLCTNDDHLALEASFTGNLVEPILTGGGIGLMTLMGVGAAAAATFVPVYQDFSE